MDSDYCSECNGWGHVPVYGGEPDEKMVCERCQGSGYDDFTPELQEE